jgi:hypothetical protein
MVPPLPTLASKNSPLPNGEIRRNSSLYADVAAVYKLAAGTCTGRVEMNANPTPVSTDEQQKSSMLLDVLIRAGLVFALAALCYKIFAPFLTLMVWALILAVAMYPLHQMLARRIGGRLDPAVARSAHLPGLVSDHRKAGDAGISA